MRQNIQEHFRILGLHPGVGPLEIRRAYRQMVQRWHPDHFKPGSPMQATAEDITKDLNNAFEQLYRKKLYRKFVHKSDSTAEPDAADGEKSRTQAPAGGTAAPAPPDPKTSERPRRPFIGAWSARMREFLKSGPFFRRPKHIPWARATAVAGLAVLLVPIWQKTHERKSVETVMQTEAERRGQPADEAAHPPAGDATRGDESGDDAGLKKDDAPHAVAPMAERSVQNSVDMTISFGRSSSETHIRKAEAALDVFEVGDTKEKVMAIQGAPDEATENLLRYGASVVYLQDGMVSGWSDQLPRLHIRKWTTIESALDTFTFGSTMREVVQAQGLPTTFTQNSYTYGSSSIYFENDRVIGWNESDVPLRSFDLPVSPFVDLDRFRAPVLPSLGDFRITAAPRVGY
jgi:hypothetical protein